MKLDVPGLWFMSWYDVSVGPNLAMFNHVRQHAQARGRGPAVGRHRPRRPLRLHPRHRGHRRGRAQHGRRPPRLRGDRLRLLRPVLEGREGHPARHAAEGHVLHHGPQQVADLEHLAARRARETRTFYLVERRPGQLAQRRRRLALASPEMDQPDTFDLRSREPRAVLRRQRLLHRQRGPGGIVRPAPDGSAGRRARLHLRALRGGHGAERTHRAHASTCRPTPRTPTSR